MLGAFRASQIKADAASQKLGLSRSRFYELYSDYLKACAHHKQDAWTPSVSGGDHAPEWPAPVQALLRRRLSSQPPSSYSFAASEALRLHGFKVDRAQVRRWAMEQQLAHPKAIRPARAAVRRWQRSQIGELWQLDATPHRWFRHSLFFSHDPQALTQLGRALHFYGITFRYAPTPQAKGKVERAHFFWQERLPAYFASEDIADLDQAHPHLQALRLHRNQHEIHRELKMTPQKAWDLAQKEGRSVLRAKPNCPWWPFVWSLRIPIKVGPDGRVPIGSQTLRIQAAPGAKVILCPHPSGHSSVLAAPPDQKNKPLILFSNLPK